MDIAKTLRESCFCEGRGCELCRAADEIDRLRAELAERKATTPAPKPDCRTCSKYLPPIYAFSEPACPRRKISMDPCINGSHYRPADPVRLYETGEA